MDQHGLVDLALVAGLYIPPDVGLECWPPKTISKGAVSRIKSLVPKLVMSVMDEGITLGERGIELVMSIALLPPESSIGNGEFSGSADKTGERVARQVGGSALREEVLVNMLDFFIGLVCLITGQELDGCGVFIA